jgi:hypothetical protein
MMILVFKFLQEFFNFGWFFIEPGNFDYSVFVRHFNIEVIGFAFAMGSAAMLKNMEENI